jgi:hypothetical protein
MSMYRHHVFIRVTRKARRCKINLREERSEFYTGLGLLESKNPTSSLALLMYIFLLLILISSMEFGLLLLYSVERPYKYDKFLTLLQLTQTHTQSELLHGPYTTSWAVADNRPLAQAIFMVLSLAPEHVIKPENFGS